MDCVNRALSQVCACLFAFLEVKTRNSDCFANYNRSPEAHVSSAAYPRRVAHSSLPSASSGTIHLRLPHACPAFRRVGTQNARYEEVESNVSGDAPIERSEDREMRRSKDAQRSRLGSSIQPRTRKMQPTAQAVGECHKDDLAPAGRRESTHNFSTKINPQLVTSNLYSKLSKSPNWNYAPARPHPEAGGREPKAES